MFEMGLCVVHLFPSFFLRFGKCILESFSYAAYIDQ